MVLSAVVILAVATGLTNADPANVLAAVVRLAVATGLTDALAVIVLSAVVRLPDAVAPLAAAPPPWIPSGFVPSGNAPSVNQATPANNRTVLRLATVARAWQFYALLLRRISLYLSELSRQISAVPA